MLGIRKESVEEKVFRIRYTAHTGLAIPQHHAMRRVSFTPELLVSIVLVPVIFTYLLIHFNPLVADFWHGIFDFWINKLGLPGSTGFVGFQLFGEDMMVAFPDVPAVAPTAYMGWGSFIIGVAIFVLSYRIAKTYLPLAYFMRLVLILLFSTHIFFALRPDFAYEPGQLVGGNLLLSYKLLLMAPWIMAFTYNIFDFSLFKKFMISGIIIGYLILFLPFQYMLHAVIIHHASLLFLPVLHLIFGSFMDILMFMALYSWGLSWKRKKFVPIRA